MASGAARLAEQLRTAAVKRGLRLVGSPGRVPKSTPDRRWVVLVTDGERLGRMYAGAGWEPTVSEVIWDKEGV